MKYVSKSLEETEKIARDFVATFAPNSAATVVGLYGTLGAGKTAFTQAAARALGVGEEITSPTFVIEKVYELAGKPFARLVHIDAYRLLKPEELLHLGWRELILDPQNLIFIEWPENVAAIMPPHIQIRLKTLDSGEAREIDVAVPAE
jgi:tRNA threonylcarbamoyladenosine biosynthesis protein TsaE